ncbi:MmcB family DNA repair protein [Reyranella sp.]|uniref:MmcB family DNA repair protein n=1 Tax=Reyranella sp. TaxID=1929291 RepID=UPI0040354E68
MDATQNVARQARPDITLAVCRGACRLMRQTGRSVLRELPLPDGRRADIMAIAGSGELTIVEVKSSIEDWRVDQKWPDYLAWCDLLYFAVPVDFPQALIAEEVGLIVADAYGADILRHPIRRPVAAARRKALLVDCARLASERLARLEDPEFVDFV